MIKAEEFNLDKGIVDSLEKILWLVDNCFYFKNLFIAHATRIYIENEDFIKKCIEKSKPQQ